MKFHPGFETNTSEATTYLFLVAFFFFAAFFFVAKVNLLQVEKP